jgi:hypothetical protein
METAYALVSLLDSGDRVHVLERVPLRHCRSEPGRRWLFPAIAAQTDAKQRMRLLTGLLRGIQKNYDCPSGSVTPDLDEIDTVWRLIQQIPKRFLYEICRLLWEFQSCLKAGERHIGPLTAEQKEHWASIQAQVKAVL